MPCEFRSGGSMCDQGYGCTIIVPGSTSTRPGTVLCTGDVSTRRVKI